MHLMDIPRLGHTHLDIVCPLRILSSYPARKVITRISFSKVILFFQIIHGISLIFCARYQ